MKSVAGTPAEIEAMRLAISDARGYPKRGQAYRRDGGTGELQHVTGDRRFDVGTLATFTPELSNSDDGTLQSFDVETGTLAIPPSVVAFLRDEPDLPAKIRIVLARRRLQPVGYGL